MVESGKTATAFRNIIFREGQQYVGLSGEKKNEFSSMFYTGWILYRHYGLRVEDLAITEDGEISVSYTHLDVYKRQGRRIVVDDIKFFCL